MIVCGRVTHSIFPDLLGQRGFLFFLLVVQGTTQIHRRCFDKGRHLAKWWFFLHARPLALSVFAILGWEPQKVASCMAFWAHFGRSEPFEVSFSMAPV